MTQLVAQLQFPLSLKDKWPTQVLTAEAHLDPEAEPHIGPWSMRARLWTPPDEQGHAFAWIDFLSPDAPALPSNLERSFDLTLGATTVASCRVVEMSAALGVKAAGE